MYILRKKVVTKESVNYISLNVLVILAFINNINLKHVLKMQKLIEEIVVLKFVGTISIKKFNDGQADSNGG